MCGGGIPKPAGGQVVVEEVEEEVGGIDGFCMHACMHACEYV